MRHGAKPQRASGVRSAWWLVLATLAVLELSLIPTDLAPNVRSFSSSVLGYFVPILLTIGAGLYVAGRVPGIERWFWGLLALAPAFVLPADAYLRYYETWVDSRGPQLPGGFELGYVAALATLVVFVFAMTDFGDWPIVTGLRVSLDVLGGAIVAFSGVYWWWTRPLFADLPMGHWPVAAIAAVYPVAGGLILLMTATGLTAHRWRIWERLVVASFVVYGVGLATFPVAYAAVLRGSRMAYRLDWYVTALGLGFYLLFMAAVYRITSDDAQVTDKLWSISDTRRASFSMLYPLFLALALLALGLGATRVMDAPGGSVLVVATAVLTVVLIVRSWLSSIDLAHHRTRSITDATTGVYNLRHLHERLPSDLADAAIAEQTVAAIVFDVVDFRGITLMAGRAEGDRLLGEIVSALRIESPAESSTYRIGSDEFTAIVPGFSAVEATTLAHRVNARVARTVTADGVPVALSAGVAVFPQHGSDAETLVSRALASQQVALTAERTDVVVYDLEVVDAADPLVRLESSRKRAHRAKLRALAGVVDARDQDRRLHSEIMNEVVSAFALVLELSDEDARLLESAALLHDIGNIGVPDEVLLKPGQLSASERSVIEGHPVLSERILRPADIPEVLRAVRHHHERWDGTGYPDGLAGAGIPFEARVLAICDAFEAMTNTRRYRPALSTVQALAELKRCSGTQFDPQLAESFCRMVVRMHGHALSKRSVLVRRTPNVESHT